MAHGASDTRQTVPSTKHSRSRTTIPTQSGKWLLVKTIGAGSMGKVKLARKEDGSEQVRPILSSNDFSSFPKTNSFLPSPIGGVQNYPKRLC